MEAGGLETKVAQMKDERRCAEWEEQGRNYLVEQKGRLFKKTVSMLFRRA